MPTHIIRRVDRRGRYRWRTWLRGVLPYGLALRIPKGRADCGAHEWYRSDEHTWCCYHCEVGVTHVSPFSGAEQVAGRLAAIGWRFKALEARPYTEAVAGEARELFDEASVLAGECAGDVPLHGFRGAKHRRRTMR